MMGELVKGVLLGLVAGSVITWLVMTRNAEPTPPAFDLSPYQDSIRILAREKQLAADRAAMHLRAADSLRRILNTDKKHFDHDIKVIEAAGPDLLRHFHDSVMRANGLR